MSDVLDLRPGAAPNPQGAVGASMATAPRSAPLLRVVTPDALAAQEAASETARQDAERPIPNAQVQGLAGYIRRQFETMKRHRQGASGWNDRLLRAQRQFNGEYDADTLAAIRAFGGSEVFARVVSVKCRGATAMLREVYLSGQRSWGIAPTPDPKLPDSMSSAIDNLIEAEVASAVSAGLQINEQQQTERRTLLLNEAARAARDRARQEAMNAERRLDDLLIEGNFYTALADFLSDIPLYPFACIKGPVVQMAPQVKWVNRKAVQTLTPKMFWQRISPFDIWWTGGAGSIEKADVIELQRLTRADLNALIDVPGYDSKSLLGILAEYSNGYREAFNDATDAPRAAAESREDPNMNESGMYDCLEFNGSVQGKMLIEAGMPASKIKEPVRDYFVQAWLIGNRVIKVQLSPSPRKRHPYFITSFEKIPGTIVGNAIPDIISDIQDVCNATLRALVNNMAMASGPQVVVDMSQLADGENPFSMYPWKRWLVESRRQPGAATSRAPIDFFQPDAHINDLLLAYKELTNIADELSAIPRYLTGSGNNSSVGRTASGLAMLMNNASKVLQTVASNIDRDVVGPILEYLYDIVMLTDTNPDVPGALRGDENIEVKGVAVAVQRETERQRQIEFLQATANPLDQEIMGLRGRARLLRQVAKTTGTDGENIVPPDEQVAAMERAKQAAALGVGGPPGAAPPGVPGGEGGGGAGGASPPPQDRSMHSVGAPGRPGGAVMNQLARSAQGAQRGGANTGPARGTGPRVNLYEQRQAA